MKCICLYFYLNNQIEYIYIFICLLLRFWPSDVKDIVLYDGSWRQMFIERPSVLTIGCYISKISYVRRGEESFVDNTNGRSFNVVYYRYLR